MKQVKEDMYTPQKIRENKASKIAYRDIKNSIDTAKQESLAEGMELGMEKGMRMRHTQDYYMMTLK